jgi:hypothetical protein
MLPAALLALAPVVVLNTMPATGPDAVLYAGSSTSAEIAVPFTVGAAGTITTISTGIHLTDQMMCGVNLGISGVGFRYVHSGYDMEGCHRDDFPAVSAPLYTPITLTDLDWHLAPGTYALEAWFPYDLSFAAWYTNPDVLGAWQVRVLGWGTHLSPTWADDCAPAWQSKWTSCGLAALPTPAARIEMALDALPAAAANVLRVPEPLSSVLALLSIFMIGVTTHRSNRNA